MNKYTNKNEHDDISAQTKYIVQWDKASDDGVPKVSMVTLIEDYTIFDFSAASYEQSGITMVDHKEIELNTIFAQDNQTHWDTIQDALDHMTVL